jgi:tetratricopeptide (TPR) repeat protein
VYLVNVETPQHAGQGVLKVAKGEGLSDEASRQELARAKAPNLESRLPAITHQFKGDGVSALLLTVAGGGLLEAETIATADHARLSVALQKTSESLLIEWNANCIFGETVSPMAIMEEWLGRRLAPSGRLREVVRECLSGDYASPGFRFGGVDYPNPYGFSDQDFAGNSTALSPGRGLVHGDLHGENILVNGANPMAYFFIDFAQFSADAPLFFDHAYLEVHLLLAQREAVTVQRWQTICSDLSGITRPQDAVRASNSEDEGLLRTLGMLREPCERWAKSKFPQRREDLKKQLLLARIAAGINYASKRAFSGESAALKKTRFLCFLYAAEAAREFFKYCKIAVPSDGPVARPEGEAVVPTSDQWRKAWTECEGFPSDYGTYILAAGPDVAELAEHTLATVSRLPWAMVIDFGTEGPIGKFPSTAIPIILKRRLITQAYPHQAAAIDIQSSACWYFADSAPDAGTQESSPATWRRNTLSGIRNIVDQLRRATVPMPVFLLVLGDKFDAAKLRNVFTTVEEAAGGSLRTVVVSTAVENAPYDSLRIETDDVVRVDCTISDFALGVHQMLGDEVGADSLWVPVRRVKDKTVSLMRLEDRDAARFSGAVRVVPANGSAFQEHHDGGEVADFLRGNVISWHDLDLHRDVDRDASIEALSRLRKLLSGSPSESFAIEHSPGAGGTTLARRLAWSLRNEFPCVVIEAFSDGAIEDIDYLFRLTNLPVLVIAEATRVAGARRDKLYDELKSRNVRFIILDVRRRHNPRSTEVSAALSDPMPLTDASRFLSIYASKAPSSRRVMLEKLAKDSRFSSHRSAFFFGLYAYETEFYGVESYVASLMGELPKEGKLRLAQLALVTRFSQERLPLAVFMSILGLPTTSKQAQPAKCLGDAAAKLIMFDGRGVSISHPLLAEEALRLYLTPASSELPKAWKLNLTEFCVDWISEVSTSSYRDSQEVQEILVDLFIERSDWSGSSDLSQFSSLIQELPTPESQRRVLEHLCNNFPENPHFWNHLGRHINFKQTGTFEEAEEKLKKAIELEHKDELHHHGLGMIYRLEVRRRLESYLREGETIRSRLDAIEGLVAKAEECFATARGLNPASRYSVVTPIQMAVETFERLCNLAGQANYQEFLLAPTYVSEWCRAKIATAEALMSRLYQLEANSQHSDYTLRCDARLEEVHGNFAGLVSGLARLLARGDADKPPIRRMLARAYIRQTAISSGVTTEHFRKVADLMLQNLRDDPGNGNDVRNWFRAYRMLPNFSLSEAIETMAQWSLVSESIDASYYLGILHFMQAKRGVHKSLNDAKRYFESVKKNAPALLARKSFEWWANDSLKRPCPLVHHSELGEWSQELDFFKGSEKLGRVEGRIDRIQSPQSGQISVDGLPAFFVPRSDFRTDVDLNTQVEFFLGFSYEGLRAWGVQRQH